jgi:hypothetical protein
MQRTTAGSKILNPKTRATPRSHEWLRSSLPSGLHASMRLMPALVAFESANFGAITLDLIGRASRQVRVAAALGATDRSNESLLLDDEGTPLHSPPIIQNPRLNKTWQIARNLDRVPLSKISLCKTVRGREMSKDRPSSREASNRVCMRGTRVDASRLLFVTPAASGPHAPNCWRGELAADRMGHESGVDAGTAGSWHRALAPWPRSASGGSGPSLSSRGVRHGPAARSSA